MGSKLDEYLRPVEELPRAEMREEELERELGRLECEAATTEDELGRARRHLESIKNRMVELEDDPEVEEEKIYRAGIANPNQIKFDFLVS